VIIPPLLASLSGMGNYYIRTSGIWNTPLIALVMLLSSITPILLGLSISFIVIFLTISVGMILSWVIDSLIAWEEKVHEENQK
jgi:hypothetical protein